MVYCVISSSFIVVNVAKDMFTELRTACRIQERQKDTKEAAEVAEIQVCRAEIALRSSRRFWERIDYFLTSTVTHQPCTKKEHEAEEAEFRFCQPQVLIDVKAPCPCKNFSGFHAEYPMCQGCGTRLEDKQETYFFASFNSFSILAVVRATVYALKVNHSNGRFTFEPVKTVWMFGPAEFIVKDDGLMLRYLCHGCVGQVDARTKLASPLHTQRLQHLERLFNPVVAPMIDAFISHSTCLLCYHEHY
jgi:hypothetical protein